MKQLLIYNDVTPVSKEKHGKFSLKPSNSFDFARQTNSVPAVAQEFALLAMQYAIVFGQAADGVIPAVVLGVRDNENVFVAADGTWDAPYIPAFIRRYPFVFGSDDSSDTLTLLVDESHPGFNNKDKGERLFDADGEQTAYLKNVLSFLGEYQAHSQQTAIFAKTLSELGLLEQGEVHLPLPGDPERRLRGFLMVSREKLRALPADKLAELHANGILELIYLHLFSLNNMNRLQEKMVAAAPAKA
jgi:hypothetical protein